MPVKISEIPKTHLRGGWNFLVLPIRTCPLSTLDNKQISWMWPLPKNMVSLIFITPKRRAISNIGFRHFSRRKMVGMIV